MIANPSVPAFRYDPYDKKFTREVYEHGEMREVRATAVGQARKSLANVGEGKEEKEGEGRGAWAVVLGTLGRQGSLNVLNVSLGLVLFLRSARLSNVVYPQNEPEAYLMSSGAFLSSSLTYTLSLLPLRSPHHLQQPLHPWRSSSRNSPPPNSPCSPLPSPSSSKPRAHDCRSTGEPRSADRS